MEKWLVVSNCNTVGLTNSLSLLCPTIDVTAVHLLAFRREVEAGNLALETFSRALVHPTIDRYAGDHLDRLPDPIVVPSLFFCGYHPDACYVHGRGGEVVRSPAGDHHSAICFAAYQAGLRVGEAVRLFHPSTYEEAGYFDAWQSDRETELAKFDQHGIDLSPLFVRWARNGPFMYTINHPRIECIFEIARLVLAQKNIQHVNSIFLPEDNLRNGTSLPIYPEIAEQLSVVGSYYFKHIGKYRLMTLRDFVNSCFRQYDRLGKENLRNPFAQWDRFQRLTQLVGSSA